MMRISFAGNVGIGLPGPGYKLDVNGDVDIAAANVLRFITLANLDHCLTVPNLDAKADRWAVLSARFEINGTDR